MPFRSTGGDHPSHCQNECISKRGNWQATIGRIGTGRRTQTGCELVLLGLGPKRPKMRGSEVEGPIWPQLNNWKFEGNTKSG
jgi:hypothetical protein